MGFRPSAKRLIAGLTVAGLMFQVALVAAQLSILIVARADASAALPADVICTDHGLVAVPSDQTDRPATCGFCPLCLTAGAGQTAILLATGFTLVEARAIGIAFHFDFDRGASEHSAQPRSRGPPAFA
jgi:hypothetical protein